MKIMVMNVPAHGHVNPTLPVVAGLVARGHTVLYYNAEEFRSKISATGADFRAYAQREVNAAAMASAVSKHLVNVTVWLFERSLMLTAWMLDEIRREEPDLLIFDAICLWGMQAARLTGIPAVSSITTFVLEGINVPFSWRERWHFVTGAAVRLPRLLRARSALVRRYGRASLPPGHIFPCAGDLNLVFTVRELQPATPVIDHTYRFVGPSLPALPPATTFPLPEGRIVYISLGTVHAASAAFCATCFEAFADMPGTFVLVAGDLADGLQPPPNFIVQRQVPQLEVLQRADLFITHAGSNSLHEALYFGVPLVMVPQQIEQAMNARVAAMHNVGVILSGQPPYGQGINAAMLRAAAEKVLAEPSYRAAAQQMQAYLQATHGSAAALEAIVSLGEREMRQRHRAGEMAGSPTVA